MAGVWFKLGLPWVVPELSLKCTIYRKNRVKGHFEGYPGDAVSITQQV